LPQSNAQPALDLEPAIGPAIVVLGRDDAAKAHASSFTADQMLQARAAAAAMGFMALPVTTDEQRDLAMRLPAGKIFGSGKAFVPFVKAELYDQLIAQVPLADQVKRPLRLVKATDDATSEAEGGGDQLPAANPGASGKAPPLTTPADWSSLKPGSVVLATETVDEGWWPAVVLAVNGHLISLRWRDVEGLPSVVRPLTELALLHPSRKATA
jgi:hypothetical protein